MVKFGFSLAGLIVFLLPMLINLVYVILPPQGTEQEENKKKTKLETILDLFENITRFGYAILIICLVSGTKTSYTSPWMYAAVVFLVLYYVVWIRYFMNGRQISYMGKSFLGIPIPLAVFPVLYFACAAIWLSNMYAFVDMIVFGIIHYIISYRSFHVKASV